MMSTLLFYMLAAITCIHGYRMVAAPLGTCVVKRAYGIIKVRTHECRTMGGAWNLSPQENEWIDCHLDWCDVPFTGSVTTNYPVGTRHRQYVLWTTFLVGRSKTKLGPTGDLVTWSLPCLATDVLQTSYIGLIHNQPALTMVT